MTCYYDLVMAKTIRKYGKFPNEQMPKELWAPAPGLSKKKEWADIKAHFYGTQTAVITENGLIDFDPQEVMKIAHSSREWNRNDETLEGCLVLIETVDTFAKL